MDKKAAKIDIAAIEYCLADLDPKADEASEVARARYLGQLNGKFEPKPTAIINSGNGIQCLWRLDEPIDLTLYPLAQNKEGKPCLGPEAQRLVDDAEARIKEIMIRLGAEPGTQNIDRILRLPGTINLPNKVKRDKGRVECPTELISFNGASYSLDQFHCLSTTNIRQQKTVISRATKPEGTSWSVLYAMAQHPMSLKVVVTPCGSSSVKCFAVIIWKYPLKLPCWTAPTKSLLTFMTNPTRAPMFGNKLPMQGPRSAPR